jgi:hypothetical protein
MGALITNEGRIRRAALLMLLALATEALSVYWRHPLSLYILMAAGSIFCFLAIVSFLLSFVSPPARSRVRESSDDAEVLPRQAAEG